MKPKAHPTKWTLVVRAKMHLGKPFQLVYDYDSQAEAELAKALARSAPRPFGPFPKFSHPRAPINCTTVMFGPSLSDGQ